jgi:hypothetical protein
MAYSGAKVEDRFSESLRQKAVGLTLALVRESLPEVSKFYAELFGGKVDLSDAKIWELQIEEILFCLHLLDRIVSSMLAPDARAVFMTATFEAVRDSLSGLLKNGAEVDNFRRWIGDVYNARQTEYAEYTYPDTDPKNNRPSKGELFWEFGKKMAFLVGDTNPIRVMEIEHHGIGLFEMMGEVAEECITKEN